MDVFLTGATGYIGATVAGSLQKAGHSVFGLARNSAAYEKLKAANVTPIAGDLSDFAAIRGAAAKSDAVIHTAAAWGPEIARLEGIAISAILDSLRKSGKTFVYTSGTWVIGDTQGRVASELSVLRPPPHVAWRPAIEKLVLSAADENVDAVVIRPAMVFGRGGGMIGDYVKQARRGKVIRLPGTGENHWSFVHVEALAELFVRAVEQSPRGHLFLAADGPAFTTRILAETVAAMNEARVEFVPLEQARVEFGTIADALAMDQKIMSTKAGRMLGWGPKFPWVLDDIRSGSYVD